MLARHSKHPLRRCVQGPIPIQIVISSFGGDQLVVGTLLDDAPVLEDDDSPGTSDRGETVGDHDGCAPCEEAAQTFLDASLCVEVDVGSGLVENQHTRVGDQGAREGDQLALAGLELRAALADLGVVAVLEL